MSAIQPKTAIQITPLPSQTRRKLRRVLRNKSFVIGGIIVIALIFIAIFAPLVSPYNPNQPDYTALLKAPGGRHLLGTDELGRDVLSRIFIGARTSMEVSIGAVVLALVLGVPVGLISGFYRGFMDDWVIMRIVDALQAFPFLILALVFAAMLGPGITNAMIAIAIGYLPLFVRIVRAQVLAEAKKEYVEAARMIGASNWRIMWRHMLPNITTPLIVQVSIAMASGIVAEASLSYLGLGAKPPTASWGTMLKEGQGYISQDPWLSILPGIAVVIAVLGFNLLGEGLQEIWNPKSRS